MFRPTNVPSPNSPYSFCPQPRTVASLLITRLWFWDAVSVPGGATADLGSETENVMADLVVGLPCSGVLKHERPAGRPAIARDAASDEVIRAIAQPQSASTTEPSNL